MRMHEWDGLPQTHDDLVRKFNGTYVLGTLNIAAGVSSPPATLRLVVIEPGRWSVSSKANPRGQGVEVQNIDILNTTPVIGAVNYHERVLISRRRTARQWQVGVSDGTTNVVDSDTDFAPVRMSRDVAEALLEPTYPKGKSITELSKELVANKGHSIAWSNVYWLRRMKNDVALYRRTIPLGTFLFGEFFMNSPCKSFAQELWDDLRIKTASRK